MSIKITDIPSPESRPSVPRDGRDRPLVIPPQGGKPVALTRTTTFIDCIEDKSSLSDWGKRSVLLGTVREPSIIEAVRDADPNGNRVPGAKTDKPFKDLLDELAEQAMGAAGANDKREKGTYLHALSELVDAGLPLPDYVTAEDRLDLAAYVMETQDLKFSHVERFVVCPELSVGGTPDRIAYYEGPGPNGRKIKGWFIFDLKTGTTEYGGLKMAAQLAIYSRAQFYDYTVIPAPARYNEAGKETKEWKEWRSTEHPAELAATAYSPIPKVSQKWGIILNLPSGSGEAELFWADLAYGWRMAKLAQTIRTARTAGRKALQRFVASSAA